MASWVEHGETGIQLSLLVKADLWVLDARKAPQQVEGQNLSKLLWKASIKQLLEVALQVGYGNGNRNKPINQERRQSSDDNQKTNH